MSSGIDLPVREGHQGGAGAGNASASSAGAGSGAGSTQGEGAQTGATALGR